MSEAIDLAHLGGWIGGTELVEETVSPDLVRRFAATMDLEADRAEPGDPVPRLLHFCLCQPPVAGRLLGPDGHPAKGGFLPPVPLPRRMWAGGEIRFHGDLRVGDIVRRRSRVIAIDARVGRTGPLCFVTVSHAFEVGGTVLVEERQDIVYRTGEDASAPAKVEEAARGDSSVGIVIDPVLLFRYSALTFNSHRIHYDRRYAIEEERYPGLVVHGPLQATLLLNYAALRRGGEPPNHFIFRSRSSLFDHDDIGLHASGLAEGGLKLWTARAGGPVAMSAEARW